MSSTVGLALLVTVLAVVVQVSVGQDIYQVGYKLEFPPGNCLGDPDMAVPAPVTVEIPVGANAQRVLELAVDQDSSYRFSATYFGSELGYFIDAVNGTASDDPCFWFYYFQTPGNSPILAPLGVTNFIIPENETQIIFRYREFVPNPDHDNGTVAPMINTSNPIVGPRYQVDYQLEFPLESCSGDSIPPSPVTVEIPVGSSAQRVMELAVDEDRSYRFSATYFGTQLGYLIDTINGTNSSDPCFWFFYYQPPGMDPFRPDIGVTNFIIPDDGGRVIFRYEIFNPSTIPGHSPTPTPTSMPTPTDSVPPSTATVATAGVDTMDYQVDYQLEFPLESCSGDSIPPSPVTVEIPVGSSAQRVMELAVDEDRSYRFSATYFGTQFGYLIDTINGTNSSDPCFWFFYYQPPGMDPFRPDIGVTNFIIPDDGGRVIFRYEIFDPSTIPGHSPTPTPTSMPTPTDSVPPSTVTVATAGVDTMDYQVDYQLEFPLESCSGDSIPPSPVTVEIPVGSSAQRVMELAVDEDRSYRFSATYFGTQLGYLIDTINGTTSSNPCFWFFYYQPPGMDPFLPNMGVTNFIIPDDGGSVIFRYEIFDPSTVPGHSPTPTPDITDMGGGTLGLGEGKNVFLVLLSIAIGALFLI